MTSIRDLDDRQLFCLRGGFGHAWDPISKPTKEGQWGYRTHDLCTRCEKERTTVFNIYGGEASRYYRKPTWHVKVTVPHDSSDVRVEITRRRLRRARVPRITRRAA